MKPEGTGPPPDQLGNYSVRVLDRAIAILSELASEPLELGSTELSHQLHLHKSTVHRLLAVLDKAGLVERAPDSARYRLGWRMFDLGMSAALHLNLLERAKPHLMRLADDTGETAHIGVLHQGNMVSLAAVKSQGSVQTPAAVGRHTPVHCVSQGKAMLAFLPEQRVEQILARYPLRRYTENTIVDQDRFSLELALIRGRGYAIDNEEFEEGWRCVAAPVRHASGALIASISIAGPTCRMASKELPVLGRLVTRVAADLSLLQHGDFLREAL